MDIYLHTTHLVVVSQAIFFGKGTLKDFTVCEASVPQTKHKEQQTTYVLDEKIKMKNHKKIVSWF